MHLTTDFSQGPAISDADWQEGIAALRELVEKRGKGAEFTGWIEQPFAYDREEYERIRDAAARIRMHSDVLVCVGIGGSYLGTKAVLDSLLPAFEGEGVRIVYAGQTLSSSYMVQLLEFLKGKRWSINVISKSGTTTEPAIAFRILREALAKEVPAEELKERIFVTTDRKKGALKTLADAEGWETFVVPDNIGGRYSFLTAVGLLPIAAAGVDTDLLILGAQDAATRFQKPERGNDAIEYGLVRRALFEDGKAIELFVAYEPNLMTIAEWFKQLFGESEGKEGKGIFPASVQFTTDLHSMGQLIQEGVRNLFETVLFVKNTAADLNVPATEGDQDGLNYLAGTSLHEVNEKARRGVMRAHMDGGVPNLLIELERIDAYHIGYLLYFYMFSCGVSATLSGVNPFDQPGVEAYKKQMFVELGKPGA